MLCTAHKQPGGDAGRHLWGIMGHWKKALDSSWPVWSADEGWLTCLVFSSFRFNISLLSTQVRCCVSLRMVWRSWLWSMACSDAERTGEERNNIEHCVKAVEKWREGGTALFWSSKCPIFPKCWDWRRVTDSLPCTLGHGLSGTLSRVRLIRGPDDLKGLFPPV